MSQSDRTVAIAMSGSKIVIVMMSKSEYDATSKNHHALVRSDLVVELEPEAFDDWLAQVVQWWTNNPVRPVNNGQPSTPS